MSKVSIATFLNLFKDDTPNYLLKLTPILKQIGKNSYDYVQTAMSIAKLNAKNLKNEKLIDDYYKKIGKAVCDQKITIANVAAKEFIAKVKSLKAENESNTAKIKPLEAKIKKGLPDITKALPSIKKALPVINKKSTSKKKTAVKSTSKQKKTTSKSKKK